MRRLTHFLLASVLAVLAACAGDRLPTAPPPGGLRANAAPLGAAVTVVSGLATNLCLADPAGNTAPGTRMIIWTCNGYPDQKYTFQSNGQLTLADQPAVCLDVGGGQGNPGDPVILAPCGSATSQQWELTSGGQILGVNGLCLAVPESNTTPGTGIIVWTCNGYTDQQWTLRPVGGEGDGVAELPRAYVDTRMPAVTGRTLGVAAGGDLQAALDSARYGDVLALEPGATFTGNFVLRQKSGSGWIIVRSAAPDGALPATGTRLTPAFAAQLPKILAPNNEPALRTEPGAHHYRLVALEVGLVASAPDEFSYGLLDLGSAGSEQSTLAQVPTALVLDRMYVHGTSTQNVKRCVTLNSASSAIVDSYLDDCHGRGQDTQAILGWNGPGPFKIVNNYLAGAGENVLFGGVDPSIPDLVPSDIEFRDNDVVKPAAWKDVWLVKNLFETKNARRILIEHNRFDGSWLNGQDGESIVLKSANQDGGCPWCVTEHLTFRNNRIRNAGSGFVLSGQEGGTVVPMHHVLIANNLLDRMNVDVYTGANRTIRVGGVGSTVVFDHNTFSTPNAAYLLFIGSAGPGFRFANNVAYHGEYGVLTDGNTWAKDALDAMAPGYTFAANAIIGTDGAHYPAGNWFPASEADAAALRGTDGRPLGADASQLP